MLIKLDKPAYVLRTCNADMTAPYDGRFLWPKQGYVEAPDWSEDARCGHGLHGALWGEGDGGLFNWSPDAQWLVVEIDHYVELQGKVKFRGGSVVHCGDKASATAFLHDLRQGRIIGLTLTGGNRSTLTGGYGSTLTGGYGSTLTGGYGSTLTGGYGSTLTGGDDSTLTGGNRSTLTGGNRSTLTGGYGSTLTGGYGSTLTGGYGSTLTGGDDSTLTGGDDSTLTGGDDSTLTGGNRSTLTGGYGSTLTGGNRSTLIFRFYDYAAGKYRRALAEVGEAGIEADRAYRCTDKGVIVPA